MEAEFGMMHLYIKEHYALLARYQMLKEKHGKTAPIGTRKSIALPTL